ncbi:MFS transporter [Streptomyces naganishii]|uniref:MFS transporter n=1 Tax=Streptomyces naganishii JCM 4654 TaxID=1306179 RepID=A0A918Y7U7_9ACTN|nr:MFS transporter [Streptomyces naganishii]GHD93924.1 MFS transporter [Streptomyces naganishii JCM 4654]
MGEGTGARRTLGRRFGWLWAAYAVSTFGSWLAFDAFALIAVLVLHAGSARVSLLAAAGLAVGAVAAVPLGPWMEFRRKRPVMIGTDLVRFAALASVPVAYACGALGFGQLLVVSVVVSAADIAFGAASGAYLKHLVPPGDLLVANSRFESTTWTATVLGPPAGGLMVGVFGPVVTVAADAVSYLLSAAGIRAIGGGEPRPVRPGRGEKGRARLRAAGLAEGWRFVLRHPGLRPLFFNTVLVNSLIMATSPLLAVLMLGPLGFAPWQYGLAFAVPCLGGLVGSRLARTLVARFGQRRVLLGSGVLRACWSVGLAFVRPGVAGLALVMGVEVVLIACCAVFNPVFTTHRLEQTPSDRTARVLSAWSVTGKAATAAMTGLWGLLAATAGPRTAIGIAGLLLLATPLLLPWRERTPQAEAVPAVADAV